MFVLGALKTDGNRAGISENDKELIFKTFTRYQPHLSPDENARVLKISRWTLLWRLRRIFKALKIPRQKEYFRRDIAGAAVRAAQRGFVKIKKERLTQFRRVARSP